MMRPAFSWMIAGLLLLLVAALAAACSSGGVKEESPSVEAPRTVETSAGRYFLADVAQLQSMLAAKDFFFVNVHVPYEGQIEATDAFIPYDEMDAHLSELPADKNAKIVLYCRSGRMSAIAAEALVAEGYTNVWDIEGGMVAWQASGYQLLD